MTLRYPGAPSAVQGKEEPLRVHALYMGECCAPAAGAPSSAGAAGSVKAANVCRDTCKHGYVSHRVSPNVRLAGHGW